MGLKNKIRLGFLSLALLLFFSGIISYFELSRLSHSTHSMLGASFRNMELSKTMLDAVQDQNTALLQMIVSGSRNSDSMLIVGRQKFDSSMREANVLIRDLQGSTRSTPPTSPTTGSSTPTSATVCTKTASAGTSTSTKRRMPT